jgi:hypothetical protein
MTALRKASVTALPAGGWPTGAELGLALADLRRRYLGEVRSIAGRLSLDFQARRFDVTKPDEEWENGNYPFNALEHFCEALPICQDSQSARVVVAVSKYADEAAWREVECGETMPHDGQTWAGLASHCLARDVHDYAIRRGWSRSRRERGTNWTHYRRREAASR